MMHERTKRLIDDLRRLAAQGHTVSEAAALSGVTYNTAAMHARNQGIKFRRTAPWAVKANRNSEVTRRYLAGEAQADIAREFGITRERVRQICDRAGCVSERKRHADFVAIVVGTIVRKNLTLGEAAEMFDISRASVYKYCADNGVKPDRLTEEERVELSSLAKQVEGGQSIRRAADCDHNKAERLRRHLKLSGIEAKGRSRHDDFSHREDLIESWRRQGHSWAKCASLLSEHDGRAISAGGVVAWSYKHLPHLFSSRPEVSA